MERGREMNGMRRKDREVQSLDEIFDILNRCDTVRVAFRDEEYPYIVPVSFGAELMNGKVTVIFIAPERA